MRANQTPFDHFHLSSRQVASWASANHVDELLDRAMHFFSSYFSDAFVTLGLIEGDRILLRSGNGPEGKDPTQAPRRLALDGPGIIPSVARTGRIVIIADATADEQCAPAFTTHRVRSALAAPVCLGDHVLGVIALESTLPGSFTARDRRFLQTIGAELGLCVKHVSAIERLEKTILQTVTALSSMVEGKDEYTEGHCQRIAEMALAVGLRVRLSKERLDNLTYAGILHDIGKIGIPDTILLKQGPLTADEYRTMQKHTTLGRQIVETIDFLKEAAPMIEQHHEQYDGMGYPHGLRGKEILLEARILAVVDAFDAMTSTRPYRRSLPREAAIQELKNGAGRQFDPEIIEAFLKSVTAGTPNAALRRNG